MQISEDCDGVQPSGMYGSQLSNTRSGRRAQHVIRMNASQGMNEDQTEHRQWRRLQELTNKTSSYPCLLFLSFKFYFPLSLASIIDRESREGATCSGDRSKLIGTVPCRPLDHESRP